MTASVRQEWPSAWIAASSTTVASGAATSACLVGSSILAWVVWANNGSTLPTSVVDSASQSYTYSGLTIFDNNTGLNLALYYLQNNASATALTLTATWAAAQTFTGIWPAEITGVTATAFQAKSGNPQDSPGTGTGAITSTNATPTAQPCLVHALSFDAAGNAASTVAGTLGAGTTGLKLSTSTAASGTSGSVRLTSLTAYASTFTNGTDGTASFLTGQSIWTEAGAGTNTASIAWVK